MKYRPPSVCWLLNCPERTPRQGMYGVCPVHTCDCDKLKMCTGKSGCQLTIPSTKTEGDEQQPC